MKIHSKAHRIFTSRQQINIPPNNRLIIYLLTSSIIIATLILNIFWKQSLYEEGLKMISVIQKKLDYPIIRIINNIFSMFGSPIIVNALIVVQLCVVRHKFKAIIHISFYILGLYVIAFLKLAYQQSRPIWTSDQIHKWEWFCPKDFGNPSGHSFTIFPLYEPIISRYVGPKRVKVAWAMLVLFGFFVPFSRTYLGMHSVNQVMFGFTLGVGATVLYRYAIREWFYVTYSRIFKLKKIKYLLAALITHMICLALPFLFFEFYSDNRPIEQKDLINLNKICSHQGPQDDITSAYMQESMLIKCTFESFIFGIIYGLYFLNLLSMDLTKEKLYFSGRWSYLSKKAAFQYLATTVLLCGLIAVTFIFVLPKIIESTVFHYLSYTLGSTLMGFTLIFFIPKIQRLFVWIDYHQEEIVEKPKQIPLPVFEVIEPKTTLEEVSEDVSEYFG